jgi:hypothetical protein
MYPHECPQPLSVTREGRDDIASLVSNTALKRRLSEDRI